MLRPALGRMKGDVIALPDDEAWTRMSMGDVEHAADAIRRQLATEVERLKARVLRDAAFTARRHATEDFASALSHDIVQTGTRMLIEEFDKIRNEVLGQR